jgi:CheY-like chemotaxis protein
MAESCLRTAPVYSEEARKLAGIKEVSGDKHHYADLQWQRPPEVLIVENGSICREITAKFLYSNQCNIDTVSDGMEAFNKLHTSPSPYYDLILMDRVMPNLDGVSACLEIRKFSRTPIIAMTCTVRADEITMYSQHCIDDVLPKPFTRKLLLDMLVKHLPHLEERSVNKDNLHGVDTSTITLNSSVPASERLSDPESSLNGRVNHPSILQSPSTGPRVMPVHSDGRPSPENGLTNPAQRSPSTTVVPHTEAESTPLESSLSQPASTQRQPSPFSSLETTFSISLILFSEGYGEPSIYNQTKMWLEYTYVMKRCRMRLGARHTCRH